VHGTTYSAAPGRRSVQELQLPQGTTHQALYRRWRAQTFSEIVGQEAVVATLRNAVALNSIMFNLPLVLGPALAGEVIAAWGPAPVFVLDAVSYAAPVAAFRTRADGTWAQAFTLPVAGMSGLGGHGFGSVMSASGKSDL
jgi:hypothetical protein